MTTYYIRANGDDTKSGTSVANAWRTIAKVIATINAAPNRREDSFLFRKGDRFFGHVVLPAAAATSETKLVLGSWGIGSSRPIFDSAKVCNNAAGWEESTPGIWRINLAAGGPYTGNTSTASANAGYIEANGVIFSMKRMTLGELVNTWDFYSDDTHIYVKAPANPTTLASDIRIAVRVSSLSAAHSIVVAGIEFVGAGAHGISGPGSAAQDVKIVGCKIHKIGGSLLQGTTRYGNGVQLWIGSKDWDVSWNEIHDVYDTLTTMQGPSNGTTQISFENCHIHHNTGWNGNQSWEFWMESAGFENVAGSGTIKCSLHSNTFINAGYSFGALTRPDKDGKGTHVMAYNMQLPMDFDVHSNVFFGARDNYFYRNTGDFKPPAGYRFYNNDIYLDKGQKIAYQSPLTVEDSETWKNVYNCDRTSRFYTMPKTVTNAEEALAFLSGHEALSASRTKKADESVKHVFALIESLPKPVVPVIPVGTTLIKTVGADVNYSRLLTVRLINNFARFTGVFSYLVAGDSNQVSTWGFFQLAVEPNSPAGTTHVSIKYLQGNAFPTATKGFRIEDIIAVIEESNYDTGIHRIGLYLNMRATYNRMKISAVSVHLESSGATYEVIDASPLLTALPAGTQVIGT